MLEAEISPPFWTPTAEQIAELHSKLPLYLQTIQSQDAREITRGFERYRYQYFGYTAEGVRWILINAFCADELGGYDDYWRKQYLLVMDGGSCFFRVRYNTQSKIFRDLDVNGHA